jgi:hypothetical protein
VLLPQKYSKKQRIMQGLGESTPFSCIKKHQTSDKQQFKKP